MLSKAIERAQVPDLPAADPVSRAIFVLGAQRSGTTWLAKILDSHPNVLYRHEPDETAPPDPGADPERQLRAWVANRTLRTAAKRPLFPKSFLSPSQMLLRNAMAGALSGAARLPGTGERLTRLPLPGRATMDRIPNLRIVLKLVNWDATPVAGKLPHSRHLFILRHPCGQVASAMKGVEQGRFGRISRQAGLAYDDPDRAAGFAVLQGVGRDRFARLPPAAKLAWSWHAFNEPALQGLQGQSNARVVLYEALCRHPAQVAKCLFAFAGLPWHRQTEAFLAQSTMHTGRTGYYDVLRSSAQSAVQWRTTMSLEDQAAVNGVVAHSPLARHWPELAEAA